MAIEMRSKACFMFVGFVSTALGLILYIIVPHIKQAITEKEMLLLPGTYVYHYWKEMDIAVYIRVYFFNITNPMEIYENFSKPVLAEMGPYTFRETRERVNISWDENGNIFYRLVKRFYFEPDLTNGTLDDVVTTVNLLMTTAAANAKEWDSIWIYHALSLIFQQFGITWFVRKPVRQLLFEGYDDQILDSTRIFMPVPFDKFGYLYKRNGSDDGECSLYSGINGFDNYGTVHTWKGKRTSDAHDSPCNTLQGTAGELLPPFGKVGEKFTAFTFDFCRVMDFTYSEEKIFNDLKTHRYVLGASAMDDRRQNPTEKCFCRKGKCLLPGAMDVSQCNLFKYISVVASYPHFLYADRSYSDGLIGLNPDPAKHISHIDILKEFGIDLNFALRMQLNSVFQPVKQLPQFSNLTNITYIPIVWFEEAGHVRKEFIDFMKLVHKTIPMVVDGIIIFFVAVGVTIVISALIMLIICPHRKKNPKYGAYQKVVFHNLKSNLQKTTRRNEMLTSV